MTALLLFIVIAVAFANGTNDVSKSVGTLVGSGLATYREGLLWGTIWTVAGALAAILVSAGLATTFSTGLLQTVPVELDRFLFAVSVGVFGWVILASKAGLPVSTTHAMTGAILGTALVMEGFAAVRWPLLGMTVFLPLVLSPLLAGTITYFLHALGTGPLSAASRYCICLEERSIAVVQIGATVSAAASELSPSSAIVVGESAECARDSVVSRIRIIDATHWITSAALSFARGMNDNPKIIGLGIAAAYAAGIGSAAIFAAGAVAMGAGGLLYGRRVTNTLAEKITEIDPREGLSASLVASVLVLFASFIALPVSTTHVSTGAIIGAGLRGGRRAIQWKTVRAAALAWIVTLPVAALIAAVAGTALGLAK